jgi:DNA-binding MarR family transcriptional regulator
MQSSDLDKPAKKTRARLTFIDGLWQLMVRTDHIVVKLRQKELRQYGITMNEAVVLFTVTRLKKLATPANISRQLFWEPHTVSEQLNSMEKKGLITRIRDFDRQNLIRVEVTEKGLEAYSKSSRWQSTRKTMSVLTKEEQVQLWGLLAKIRENAMEELGIHGSDPFPPFDRTSCNIQKRQLSVTSS